MHYKEILESYYKVNEDKPEESAKKLHNVVDKILKRFGGITDIDRDECYSIANLEITKYVKSQLDKGIEDFDEDQFNGFIYFAISRKVKMHITRKNRQKRCKIVTKVEDGKEIKEYIYPTSLDNLMSDDGKTKMIDIIPSDFDIESSINVGELLNLGENVVKYIASLGCIERKIADLIMQGCNPTEIKNILKLSDKEYNTYLSDMKEYEKRQLLKTEECEIANIEEELPMETKTTTSERTKSTSYSIESLSKQLRQHRLRDNHPLQRTSGQWNLLTKSELISDILQGNSLLQIVISEEIKAGIIMHWLIDGKQRSTNLKDYLEDGFAISKNVQRYMIEYQTDKTDEDGNVILNEDGFPIPESKTFDIRGKKFSQLPEELQDKFKDYQVPVMLNLNCTKKDIAYDIARFNRCRPMNVSQSGWLGLEESYAEYVDKILKMDFFKVDCDKSSYSNTNIKNGSLRRVIIEAIMTSKYLSHFDKDFGKMCIYLTENANESVFIDFYLTLEKLSNVLKGDTSDIFNNKNSFLWFALFDKFIEYGVEDDKFNDFIQEFKETLHSKEIDGVTYDCLNGQKGTKDRSSVTKRFNHLLTLMKEYLHIEDSIEGSESDVIEDDLFDTEVVEESDDKKPIIAEVTEYSAIGNKEIERVSGEVVDKDTLEFVKMCVDDGVTDADILDYEEDLDVVTLDVDNNSKLLDGVNHKSLIALIAYAYKMDEDIDDWFKDYFKRTNTYEIDQKRNYLHMRNDFIRFNKKGATA
ncbi:hypothetical protein [Blautia massiliensis (ex Durand et al. 2017)]|uniref:hypothetical protein n=1 Tax=Blautia massiliensis (ex Durand et al. 2017) TaxID=1737424 RepID=UPI00156DFF87|nr:hypothetical protein [Blautia massiliensis (ex Durand et al. 2017)]NSK75518.1 hypothetical protein [Blautia massiliensis (ex Durand et al. 2017)]